MRYNQIADAVEMSVRELCELAFLSGSIDTRAKPGAGIIQSGQLGGAIHRYIQKNGGDGYHSEVELRGISCFNGVYYNVSGRADGVILADGKYTVDEIKTIRSRFDADRDSSLHYAQLFCYAYFFCVKKELDEVNTRLTYYNIDTDEIKYIEKLMSFSELRDFYMKMLAAVSFRAEQLTHRFKVRMPSCASAIFPYRELRESQSEMIKECYLDIKHGCRLFCQAPTGIGKTISVLYPAIRTLGELVTDRIFYLTSKASIRREALSACKKIRECGAMIRTCVIIAREQICLCMRSDKGRRISSNCRPDLCVYADKYYERRERALTEILSGGYEYTKEVIVEAAKKFSVCPYELSLDLSEFCDVIICDYNYVFSPIAYLRRYFDDDMRKKEKYVFLVDEAHNLPKRARDMYSAKISRSDFADLGEKALEAYGGDDRNIIYRMCNEVISFLNAEKEKYSENLRYTADGKIYGYGLVKEKPEDLCEKLRKFQEKCDSWLRHAKENYLYSRVDSMLFSLYEFFTVAQKYSDGYVTFINISDEDVSVQLYCLDPSSLLSDVLDLSSASVFFSATLTPTDYFADVLGGGERAVSVSFPSPFPPENLCVAAVDNISTRYDDREKFYRRIVSYIAAAVSPKAGNYIVFFPSYKYMEDVYKIFAAKYPKVKTVLQKRNMNDAEREEFLNFFKNDENRLRVGFSILGGMFSEGVDLPGSRLIGTVIIGVGLPGISDEGNIIRDYYEEKCGRGYDYAYTFPGFNSVLQAAGRVIRRHDDKGIVVLIDDRYADGKYISLFPKSWKDIKYAGNPASLAELTRRFWNGTK